MNPLIASATARFLREVKPAPEMAAVLQACIDAADECACFARSDFASAKAWILLSRPIGLPIISAISGLFIRWRGASNVSHAAMCFELGDGRRVVWEATQPRVRQIDLRDWVGLQRHWQSSPVSLPDPDAALAWCWQHEGVPYGADSIIGYITNRWRRDDPTPDLICSELVGKACAAGGLRFVADGHERKETPGDVSRWPGLAWRTGEL